MERAERKGRVAPGHKQLLKFLGGVVLAVVVLLNLLTHVFSIVRYFGNGMEPTLKNGQILVINKLGEVSEGDVVAFYYNNKVLVRRIIAEEGKQIIISADGTVSVNSQPLDEPYVKSTTLGQCNLEFPCSVPVGDVFVMGDNREVAMDSRLREIGTVPVDQIIGKVCLVK